MRGKLYSKRGQLIYQCGSPFSVLYFNSNAYLMIRVPVNTQLITRNTSSSTQSALRGIITQKSPDNQLYQALFETAQSNNSF